MIRVLVHIKTALLRDSLVAALRATRLVDLTSCESVPESFEVIKRSARDADLILLGHNDSEILNGIIALAGMSGFKGRFIVLTRGSGRPQGLADLPQLTYFEVEKPLADLVAAIRGGRTEPGANRKRLLCDLSNQERRAAELVAEGLANKEVGARMGVSESAVKALLQRVFLKMGVRSRGQLIRLLLESRGAAA